MNKIKEGLNTAFAAYHGSRWDELLESEREVFLDTWEGILSNPEKKYQVYYLDQKTQEFINKYWDIKLLLGGVLLGVTGNLFANLLDRYFIKFGFMYDLIIVLSLLTTLYLIMQFVVRTGEDTLGTPLAKEVQDATKRLFG